jgi:DNA-directed RNA polymerase specialized sigma24 family protein
VFTIAYRRLSDERRRQARRPPIEPLAKHLDLRAADDVEADVDWLLATERLRHLFARLAPAQRDVLLLRVLGRLSIDEVARTLGKTAAAVKGLQRRGSVTLARHLAQQGVHP